ncbi:MAG: SOS response-associated peptidase [Caldilineales bacterium]|nr:SOS response-associated peptidase [Caldilineales bacterium]MDW8317225.1 SOS response-associated peptidase [Anaerolineae bacterium]
MCGRFSIFIDPARLAERFQASLPPQGLVPRYNAAPRQDLPVILNAEPHAIQLLRWGLVPSWAKDPAVGDRMINARAETLAEKPSFRAALHRRRCLVLADGFYEWQKLDGSKIPLRIALKSGEPFAFAGLWEMWQAADGSLLRTFTIVTVPPNELIAPIHDRMPAMLLPEHEAVWLDDRAGVAAWLDVLRPYPADRLVAYPVSRRVNSPANDDPSVVAPVA